MPDEIEATVVICDDDPERIAVDIDALQVLGEYPLARGPRRMIEDVYFDTPDRLLKHCAWALRIRRTAGGILIAAKGPVLRSAEGVGVRTELETPWSREGFLRVCAEVPPLRDRFLADWPSESDPVASLEKAGLVAIHCRTTRRHAADVLDPRSGDVQAELVVDRVTYRFRFGQIFHWEVEIEAKGRGDSRTVSETIQSLLCLYGRSLRRWDFGKLATGSAVEQLMEEGSISSLIERDRGLSPAAYDLIEAHFRRRRRAG